MNFRDLPKHDPEWNLLTIKESQMQFVRTDIESNKFKLATKGPSIIFVQGLFFLNQFTVWVCTYPMKKIVIQIEFMEILKFALIGWKLLFWNTKMFWPIVRKYSYSDRERCLIFETQGRECAKSLRSVEQFIRKAKNQYTFWNPMFF